MCQTCTARSAASARVARRASWGWRVCAPRCWRRRCAGRGPPSWTRRGEAPPKRQAITKADLMALGLSGGPGAAERRKELLHRLELPERLSPNALLEVLKRPVYSLGSWRIRFGEQMRKNFPEIRKKDLTKKLSCAIL